MVLVAVPRGGERPAVKAVGDVSEVHAPNSASSRITDYLAGQANRLERARARDNIFFAREPIGAVVPHRSHCARWEATFELRRHLTGHEDV